MTFHSVLQIMKRDKKKKESAGVIGIGSQVISIKELDIITAEGRIALFQVWFRLFPRKVA